ncbi:MAG: hypothetical protein ABI416_11840 [Ginsengibacter sp.]
MDCKEEIANAQKLVVHFRGDNDNQLNAVFKCFFILFYENFRRLTYKYCLGKFHTKNKEEDLANDAFTDGLMSFYYKLKLSGFEDKGALVKTVFFTFCIYKLMGLTKTLERRFKKEAITDTLLPLVGEKKPITDTINDTLDYQKLLNARDETLGRAFMELGERGTNLIIWKKILKLSNEEIAAIMGIQPDSVANEVFKSFKKLKQIADRLPGVK